MDTKLLQFLNGTRKTKCNERAEQVKDQRGQLEASGLFYGASEAAFFFLRPCLLISNSTCMLAARPLLPTHDVAWRRRKETKRWNASGA
jgi:hypothetical protein